MRSYHLSWILWLLPEAFAGKLLHLQSILQRPGLDNNTHQDRLVEHIENNKDDIIGDLAELGAKLQAEHDDPIPFLINALSSLKCAKIVQLFKRDKDMQEATLTIANRVKYYLQTIVEAGGNSFTRKQAKIIERSIHHLHLNSDQTPEEFNIDMLRRTFALTDELFAFIIKYYYAIERISMGDKEQLVLPVIKELANSDDIVVSSIYGSGKRERDFFGIKMLASKYKNIYKKIGKMVREADDGELTQYVESLSQGAISFYTFCSSEANFASDGGENLEDFDEEPLVSEILIIEIEPQTTRERLKEMKEEPNDDQSKSSKQAVAEDDCFVKKKLTLKEMEFNLKKASLMPKENVSSEDSSAEDTATTTKWTKSNKKDSQHPFTLSLREINNKIESRREKHISSWSSSSFFSDEEDVGRQKRRAFYSKERGSGSRMWIWSSIIAGTVIIGGVGWFIYWYFCIANVGKSLSSFSTI